MFRANGEPTREASSSGKQVLMMSKRVLMDLVKTFIGLLERYQLQLEKDTEFIECNRELLLGSVDYACSILKLLAVKIRVESLISASEVLVDNLVSDPDGVVSPAVLHMFSNLVCEFHLRGVL